MRTPQQQFIDAVIDPIPVFGPMLADLFYTFSSFADAMNLRGLTQDVAPLPPGDNVVQLAAKPDAVAVRKAA
jgi:hypothetical protein